jgi:hypothetical protein
MRFTSFYLSTSENSNLIIILSINDKKLLLSYHIDEIVGCFMGILIRIQDCLLENYRACGAATAGGALSTQEKCHFGRQ